MAPETPVTRAEFDIVCDLIEIIMANTDVPERMTVEGQRVLVRFGYMRGQVTDAAMEQMGVTP